MFPQFIRLSRLLTVALRRLIHRKRRAAEQALLTGITMA